MSGSYRIIDRSIFSSKDIIKHDHFILETEKHVAVYNDPRRFGFFQKIKDDKSLRKRLKHLGPEPFQSKFNLKYVCSFFKKKEKNIKSFLLDQRFVSGIGNIYANEILFDAKIRPTRKSKTITKKEHHEIAASTKKILKIAIKAGGTTLKDFYQPDGNKGYFKIDLAVYDRANEKCINCNKESIKRIVQSQRATFYCRKCQV